MFQSNNSLKETGISVVKRDNEDYESFLRRFKKKVMNSGIQKEFKETTFYEKPSVYKKRKSNEARKRLIRDQIRLEERTKVNSKSKKRDQKTRSKNIK